MPSQSVGLQLRSTVKKEGILELSLARVPIPEPQPDEVVVRIDASPINPSDLGLMFGGTDVSAAKVSGSPDDPVVTASIPPALMKGMAGRIDHSLPVGNEGAGVVVRAGSSAQAQALLSKTGPVGTLVAVVADSSCCAPFATNVPRVPSRLKPMRSSSENATRA